MSKKVSWARIPISFKNISFRGVVASILFSISSYGIGNIPLKNNLLDKLRLGWLTYGHGYTLCELLFWLSILLIIYSWTYLGYLLNTQPLKITELQIICFYRILPLIFSMPMYSRDIYSYLAQGSMDRHGFNPYTEGPVVMPGAIFENISNLWSTTTTPYGPLHIILFKAITSMANDNILLSLILTKILTLPFLILMFYSIKKLADYFAINNKFAIWLGVINPLIILHLLTGMHNEIFYIPVMLFGIYIFLRKYYISALILIGLAASIKIIAIIPVPFLFWIWYRNMKDARSDKISIKSSNLIFIGKPLVLCSLLPTGVIVVLTIILGDGFGWVAASSGSSYIINWLSLPTLTAHILVWILKPWVLITLTTALAITRMLGLALIGIGFFFIWIKYNNNIVNAVNGISLTFLLIVLLYPAALPWYYSWFFPLVAATNYSKRIYQIIIIFSIFVLLIFLPSGAIGLYSLFNVLLVALIAVISEKNVETGTILPNKIKLYTKRLVKVYHP